MSVAFVARDHARTREVGGHPVPVRVEVPGWECGPSYHYKTATELRRLGVTTSGVVPVARFRADVVRALETGSGPVLTRLRELVAWAGAALAAGATHVHVDGVA